MEIVMCPECGVPEIVTGEHRWPNNEGLVQSRQEEGLLAFLECENFDLLDDNVLNVSPDLPVRFESN